VAEEGDVRGLYAFSYDKSLPCLPGRQQAVGQPKSTVDPAV